MRRCHIDPKPIRTVSRSVQIALTRERRFQTRAERRRDHVLIQMGLFEIFDRPIVPVRKHRRQPVMWMRA